MRTLSQQVWDALFHPTIRLKADFPLTGKSLGIAYFVGWFWYAVGSFGPIALLFGYIELALHCASATLVRPLTLIFTLQGELRPSALVTICVVCFFAGFGAQVWYLNRFLRKRGSSLRKAVGFNLEPIKGSTKLGTAWNLVWRASLVAALVMLVQFVVTSIFPMKLQPTLEIVKTLAGTNYAVYFLLVTIIAPVTEETVFRGILFQSLRTTFTQWGNSDRHGYLGAIYRFFGYRPAVCDGAAIFLSSAFFAVSHFQFDPVTLFLLFFIGCILSETYRRTGTIWCGILVHVIVNTLGMLLTPHA